MGNAGPIYSDWFNFGGRAGSIQMVWPATGSPVGTLAIEVCSDYDKSNKDTATGGSPDDISAALTPSIVHPSGSAGRQTVFLPLGTSWARVKYSRTSGGASAGLQAWFQRGVM